MIADLDETIKALLIEEMPIKNGVADVNFDLPNKENTSKWTKPTVNLFLYDVRENHILRQHQWERLQPGNGRENLAHLKRSPMRVDSFYMLTTWAADPADEHRLLTRAIMALFRFPILPEDRLVGTLQKPPFDIQTQIAVHDRLTNPAEIWSAIENDMKPTIPYIVTLALDPWEEVTGPIVRHLTLRAGQSETLPRYKQLVPETSSEMAFIGGTVWDKSDKDKPLRGVNVAIKGTGLFATTDRLGRFTLGSMPPGDYTLVAWPEKGKPKEKQVTIPAKKGDYDLEM